MIKLFLTIVIMGFLVTGCKLREIHSEPPAPIVVTKSCATDPTMSNDEVIAETHKCESAGLSAQALHCGENFITTHIQCLPK